MASESKVRKKDIRGELLEIATNLGQVLGCDIVIDIDKSSYKKLIHALNESTADGTQLTFRTPYSTVEIKATNNLENDVENLSPIRTAESKFIRNRLLDTIKNLTGPERVFLTLYYHGNKDYQEIAQIMNYRVRYVHEMHKRILNSLKQSHELIDNLAKYMADKIGHGMREKCYEHAKIDIDFFMDKEA